MTPEAVLSVGREAMWVAAQVAAPVLLAGLVVGVLVSVFQAATQIQEQSLVLVPKAVVILVALGVCGGWMMMRIVDFTRTLMTSLPTLAR